MASTLLTNFFVKSSSCSSSYFSMTRRNTRICLKFGQASCVLKFIINILLLLYYLWSQSFPSQQVYVQMRDQFASVFSFIYYQTVSFFGNANLMSNLVSHHQSFAKQSVVITFHKILKRSKMPHGNYQ